MIMKKLIRTLLCCLLFLLSTGMYAQKGLQIASVFQKYGNEKGATYVELSKMLSKTWLIREKLLSIGTIDAALVSPREIFLQALRVGAVSFLLLHNHPSGDVTPSPEDKELTKRLAMLGGMMQLCLTDHIIVGDSDFFSFRQAGLI